MQSVMHSSRSRVSILVGRFAVPRLMRVLMCVALVGVLLAGAGCTRTSNRIPVTPSPPEQRKVLDYRYGWYHPASGDETIEQIARYYDRDVQLVCNLNAMAAGDRPVAGKMIYIPPNNDREAVRAALIYANQHPEIIPTEPWQPPTPKQTVASLKTTIELKTPPAPLKTVVSGSTPLEKSPEVSGSRPAQASSTPSRTTASASAARDTSSNRVVASAGVSDSARTTAARQERTPRLPSTGSPEKFAWPLRGQVVTPFSEGTRKASHGIEIAASAGDPVRASRAGRVLLAQQFPGYGRLILIDHCDGFASVYAYLEEILVKEGRQVQQGELIGRVGHKGSSTLLFFQIRRQGQKVDPMDYLD